MGNHECPCDYCGKDTRGLSGVEGCNKEQAKNCNNYKDSCFYLSGEPVTVDEWRSTNSKRKPLLRHYDPALPKAISLQVAGDDFYADFAKSHSMTRGEAKLYVLGQLYGKDYDPGDPKNEALRDDILAALHRSEK